MFRIDLHSHTEYSHDAFTTLPDCVRFAERNGLHGLAVTDHDTTEGAVKLLKMFPKTFLYVPGVEVTTPQGHILALNITEKPPGGREVDSLAHWVRERGGITVWAHPFDPFHRTPHFERLASHVDAIEVANSHVLLYERHKELALRFLSSNRKGVTAGSDSHLPETIGRTYLAFEDPPGNTDELLKWVVQGRGVPMGRRTELRWRFRKIRKQLAEWVS